MKKIVSLLTMLCMMVPLCVPVVGAVSPVEEASASVEMEAERQRLHDSVEAQLAAQDSLYLMDHFDALIDEMLIAEYSGAEALASIGPFYAPNGGVVKGTGTGIEVEGHFFNVRDTKKLYESRYDTDRVTDILRNILSNLPFGHILDIQDICNEINTNLFWSNIEIGKDGCYFYEVYDIMEMRTTTVVMRWTPPMMQLHSSIKVTDHYVNPYPY